MELLEYNIETEKVSMLDKVGQGEGRESQETIAKDFLELFIHNNSSVKEGQDKNR